MAISFNECPFCQASRWKFRPSEDKPIVLQCMSCNRAFSLTAIPVDDQRVAFVGQAYSKDFADKLDQPTLDQNLARLKELLDAGETPLESERHVLAVETSES